MKSIVVDDELWGLKRSEMECEGMALCPDDARDYAELYQKADMALCAAKARKNCIVTFASIAHVTSGQGHRDAAETGIPNEP